MKLSIKNVNFQRNSVHGEPFYSVHYTEGSHLFIATFKTIEEDETKVDWRTCRVVSPEFPSSFYRGDYIAEILQKSLDAMRKKVKAESIYDITDKVLLNY